MRVFVKSKCLTERLIKSRSISVVISKSAITPLLRGLTAIIEPGVLPIIFFATFPTARTRFDFTSTATTDGSSITISPLLLHISVLAVPKSIPRSLVNILFARFHRLYLCIYKKHIF